MYYCIYAVRWCEASSSHLQEYIPVKSVALQVPAGCPWQFLPLAGTTATKLTPPAQCSSLCSGLTITSADVVPKGFSPAQGLDVTRPVQVNRRPVSSVEMIHQRASGCALRGRVKNNTVEAWKQVKALISHFSLGVIWARQSLAVLLTERLLRYLK